LTYSQYSKFRWNQEHFTGRYFSDSLNTPSDCRHLAGVDWDQRTRKQEIYQIVGNGHKGWSPNVDKEFGNYDYLLGSDVGLVSRHQLAEVDLGCRSTSGTQVSRKICTTGQTGFCVYSTSISYHTSVR
jgi:hypothetical protein